jgi:type VI secretion system secreted protein Hcp
MPCHATKKTISRATTRAVGEGRTRGSPVRIRGESVDPKHKDEIELVSYNWGLAHASSPGGAGAGGATTGRAHFHDFSFTLLVNEGSPKLFLAAASGRHLKDATLTVRKAGKDPLEYLTIAFSDVVVTSFEQAGDQEPLRDAVSLAEDVGPGVRRAACRVYLGGPHPKGPSSDEDVAPFVRTCDSAVFADPNMKNAVVYGPLLLVGIPEAANLPQRAFEPHGDRYGAIKLLAVVRGPHDVTVTIPMGQRDSVSLLYDPDARANEHGFLFAAGDARVTFEACSEREP